MLSCEIFINNNFILHIFTCYSHRVVHFPCQFPRRRWQRPVLLIWWFIHWTDGIASSDHRVAFKTRIRFYQGRFVFNVIVCQFVTGGNMLDCHYIFAEDNHVSQARMVHPCPVFIFNMHIVSYLNTGGGRCRQYGTFQGKYNIPKFIFSQRN